MPSNDPFDLPDGYGGVGGVADGGPRKTIAELEAEVRAQRSAPPAPPFGGVTHSISKIFDKMHGSVRTAPQPSQNGVTPHETSVPPPSKWRRRWTWAKRGLVAFAVIFTLTVAWLAWTAPLSKSLEPIAPPQLTLVSAEGRPIARNGAIVDEPVEVAKLPPHVIEAFLATEDRRFYSHWGVDPIGIARAVWNNLTSDSTAGGSTITQQLAKFTFLNADQTYSRKARELLIAWWMEAWLTKDEILSRYLSNAYFGDNVYGLRAASLHYFYRQPEHLTLAQATMLAGLVKAPSRLAPTRNLRGAQARQRVVIAGMIDADYLTAAEAARIRPASIDHRARSTLPTGTYFADWAMPQARATIQAGYGEARVTTTLNARLQDIARRVTSRAGIGRAQVALVAMRPNGEVVAMVGGRSYADSPFNRATQALRQPGSTFKLAVYLAALRAGMTPETMVDDSPITTGDYRPVNYGARYRGQITLREAFAGSSNVVAVRLYNQVGGSAVRAAARDLGITSPIADNASSALGSSGTTLLQLTAAFATIAGNYGPVEPHALRQEEPGLIESLFDGRSAMPSSHRAAMLDMLSAVIDDGRGGGTGRAARLSVPAFGKTGTTQDYRDALFVGFAGDLVVGVWIGNDDNSPLRGMTGGSEPARIWRAFMAEAVPGAAPRPRRPAPRPRPDAAIFDDLPVISEPEITIDPQDGIAVDASVGPLDVTINRDGVTVQPSNRDTAVQKER
ncbi:MAG: transglycosylase domain-containing protein [Sphingopyxis sp.]